MAQNYTHLPKETFSFVHEGDRISDKKFEDKPIGYFKDAWIRFRKNRASVVAAIIIIAIILFSFLTPLFITTHDNSFMVPQYARKPARVTWLRDTIGAVDGGVERTITEPELIRLMSMGVGAANWDGTPVSVAQGMEDYHQPVMKQDDPVIVLDARKKEVNNYPVRVDTYLEVGFLYMSIPQAELQSILDFQEETGLQVLYPLVEDNQWNPGATDANNWYKAKKVGYPVSVNANGQAVNLRFNGIFHILTQNGFHSMAEICHFFGIEHILQAFQRNLMLVFFKTGQHFITHALSGRGRIKKLGMICLKSEQLGIHAVIFKIGNFGVILNVILSVVIVQLLAQIGRARLNLCQKNHIPNFNLTIQIYYNTHLFKFH